MFNNQIPKTRSSKYAHLHETNRTLLDFETLAQNGPELLYAGGDAELRQWPIL